MKYVYIIAADMNGKWLFKIGRTKDLAQRFAALKTMSPARLILAHAFPADNSRDAEARLHHEMADRRVHGEWFDLTRREVVILLLIRGYQRKRFLFDRSIFAA